ncbi:MAG: molybdopterin synthase catalytic subunit [Chloroflexi bacterium]|nr:MAG: molybdopterin synthase catalytic subunit [Chloroflexota bacterium]
MIQVTRQAINPDAVTETVLDPANGGVVTFLGTTRNHTSDRAVVSLEYEAYEEMAYKELERIAQEAQVNFGVRTVSIVHRFGHLDIGDISLVVAVGSAHRKEAFAAAQYTVDRIKETVPIWKKEVFEDGEVWVGIDACYAEGDQEPHSSSVSAHSHAG